MIVKKQIYIRIVIDYQILIKNNNESESEISKITPGMLFVELKAIEMNELIKRNVLERVIIKIEHKLNKADQLIHTFTM